jgi:hypothetical protein
MYSIDEPELPPELALGTVLPEVDEATPPEDLYAPAEFEIFDWPSIVPSAHDLVVYAVDDELVDLTRNLRAAGVRL